MATIGQSDAPRLERIIKLGGAAVTVKDRFETLNAAVLAAVAAQLAEVLGDGGTPSEGGPGGGAPGRGGGGTVVVHGAGSFGHFQAHKYGVSKGHGGGPGVAPPPRLLKGFCETRLSVTTLNREVVAALVEAGVPAVGVPLLGSWSTEDRHVVEAGLRQVGALVALGAIPVLHGDAVLDAALGCTILSGDVVVERLAEAFRPRHVVFLTDVPGVFDRPPADEGARRIPTIRVRGGKIVSDGEMRMDSAAHDVTGGMATKVESAAKIVAGGETAAVLIAKAGTEDGKQAMRGALEGGGMGQGWEGTVVWAEGAG